MAAPVGAMVALWLAVVAQVVQLVKLVQMVQLLLVQFKWCS